MPDSAKGIDAVSDKIDDAVTLNVDWNDDDGSMYAQRVYDDPQQVVWEISDDSKQLYSLTLEVVDG